jgi:pimeloyl-ACP methyl ester carboxylesterase
MKKLVIVFALITVGIIWLPLLARAQACDDSIPGYPDVIGEYLQIRGADASGSPNVLNTAAFLRVRTVLDGDRPKPANAVLVVQPGGSSYPTHWLPLASQLVHKASKKTCADGEPCRVEVWIMKRRGANLEDTIGIKEAREKYDPKVALDYYFGPSILTDPDPKLIRSTLPGRFPLNPPKELVGRSDAKWKPLLHQDLLFMSEWGFETYAGDIEAMINLIGKKYQPKNVFLGGHSQGTGFVSNYAGRLQKDGSRGHEKLAGLIFLDGGPTPGTNPGAPSLQDIDNYFNNFFFSPNNAYTGVNKLRAGQVNLYTDAGGVIGNLSGPAANAKMVCQSLYYALTSDAESIFQPLWGYTTTPYGGGMDFLSKIRLTYFAHAGFGFDVDPLSPPGIGVPLQNPIITMLGVGLGRLDFTPRPGTEAECDRSKATIPANICFPTANQLDPNKVYGWLEAGGAGQISTKVGKAKLWQNANAYLPCSTNVRPHIVDFPVSGRKTIDASYMSNRILYPAERYEMDMDFLGRYHKYQIHEQGVNLDIDKDEIAGIPAYAARRATPASPSSPFPGVTDYTEINQNGVFQTSEAKAITPFDPAINSKLYNHTDFCMADDSLAGSVTPGKPGASLVANTLLDWMLARSEGRAPVPIPVVLGVRER